jgi:serine protease inhibitor
LVVYRCLQVDEYGTEAAGAVELVTSQRVHGEPNGAHSTNDELVVDRPFLWFLVENLSKAILFAGRITCPTQTGTASTTVG